MVGRFGVGQHLPDLAQSFQLIDVPWTAGKSYRIRIHYKNLSYNLSRDVDGISLFAFNGGGEVRDSVWPQDGEGVLRVFRDATLNQEVTGDVVGGTVYAAFEIRVGARQKLNSSSATVRVTDLWPNYTTQAKSFDLGFNLTNGTGWQKRVGDSGPWSDANEAPSTPNDGDEPISYRAKAAWNTRTQPLGNNGNHSLAAVSELSFAPIAGGNAYNGGPMAVNVDVKNLVITSANPIDYFAVQSSEALPVTISVGVDDNDPSQPLNLTATIRPTLNPLQIVRTLSLSSRTGRSHAFSWNGNDDAGNAVPFGFYTFEIEVTQASDNDSARYRSSYLTLTQHDFKFLEAQDSEFDPKPLLEENNTNTAHVTYNMSETPLANSVAIRLYDVDFSEEDNVDNISDQVRSATNPVILHAGISNLAEAVIDARAIITASDNRVTTNRDHQVRRMLAWNKPQTRNRVRYAYQYILNSQESSELRLMRRVGNATTWGMQSSWTAISGATAAANDPDKSWTSRDSDNGKNGSVPLLVEVNNAKPYRVGPRESANGEQGIQVELSDGNGGIKKVAYKYAIHDNTMETNATADSGRATTVFTKKGSTLTRGDQGRLLVHPDGRGRNNEWKDDEVDPDVLTGSAGCIAFLPSKAESFDNSIKFLRDPNKSKVSWHDSNYVKSGVEFFPLFVYEDYRTSRNNITHDKPGIWDFLYYQAR